jgi:hypothetical protein
MPDCHALAKPAACGRCRTLMAVPPKVPAPSGLVRQSPFGD